MLRTILFLTLLVVGVTAAKCSAKGTRTTFHGAKDCRPAVRYRYDKVFRECLVEMVKCVQRDIEATYESYESCKAENGGLEKEDRYKDVQCPASTVPVYHAEKRVMIGKKCADDFCPKGTTCENDNRGFSFCCLKHNL